MSSLPEGDRRRRRNRDRDRDRERARGDPDYRRSDRNNQRGNDDGDRRPNRGNRDNRDRRSGGDSGGGGGGGGGDSDNRRSGGGSGGGGLNTSLPLSNGGLGGRRGMGGGGGDSASQSAASSHMPPYGSGSGGGGGARGGHLVSPPTMATIRDPSQVFPGAPYQTMSELTIQTQLRNSLIAQPPKLGTTQVASSKFMHFTTINNLEQQPRPHRLVNDTSIQCYQTVNRYNGRSVFLRRIVSTTTSPEHCATVCEHLRHFRHPNLVPLHSIMHTSEFVLGYTDAIMEYRYIRGAKTIQEYFLSPGANGAPPPTPGESTLWSIACQLLGLIRMFHECGVPLRGLHPNKVLYLVVGGRVLFSGLGVMELIAPSKDPVEKLMKIDINHLGIILLQLASQNPTATSMDALPQSLVSLSPVLTHFIKSCLEGTHRADDLCRGLGERMAIELGHQLGHSDFLMGECSKEIHNGRLLKLLVKLNFVYASTNDLTSDAELFALRLLYTFMFHQEDDAGRPRHDWGHVFFCLNKLDVGSEDLVQLISMDSDSTLLVISYRDLRGLLDKALDAMLPKPDLSLLISGAGAPGAGSVPNPGATPFPVPGVAGPGGSSQTSSTPIMSGPSAVLPT